MAGGATSATCLPQTLIPDWEPHGPGFLLSLRDGSFPRFSLKAVAMTVNLFGPSADYKGLSGAPRR